MPCTSSTSWRSRSRRRTGAGSCGAAIGEHAFRIGHGAVERAQQLRREGLHGRVLDPAQPVGDQLRRGQDVAHVVVDLGDGEAEIGQMLLFAEDALQLPLHAGELALGDADLVLAVAAGRTMRSGSSGAGAKASIELRMSRIGRIMRRGSPRRPGWR